jgi:ATP-binding protein involved in chromosome partitioning
VVVTIPSDVSHLVVRRSITVAANTRAPVLGLVENMSGLFVGPDASRLAADAGIPFLGSVPFDRALAVAGDQGDPFVASAPERMAAMALRRIAEGIRTALAPRPV